MGNLGSATLTVLPFFAITVYYKNFTLEIFTLAAFLMLLLSIKELMKDLCNLKGDLTNNYKTIPTAFGENITKWLITLLIMFCHGVVILLYFFYTLNSMLYYFLFSLILLLVFGLFMWRSSMNNHMAMILLGIKFLIVLGIFSLPLLRIPM
jgi:4-hydroxybenzoate polyprenyltransferase